MSIQVHIVVGSTGQYDGYFEWFVCAYQDKQKADEHARLANIEADKIKNMNYKDLYDINGVLKVKNLYDAYINANDAKYQVASVDLVDAIPGIDG